MKKRRLFFALILSVVAVIATCSIVAASSAYTGTKQYTHNSRFSNCIILDGIDTSYWQYDNVDWERMKREGIDFAYLRIGYTGLSSTSDYGNKDSYFDSNYKKAKEAGIMVGVYYYARPTSTTKAKDEAKWVVNQLKNYDIDLPVVMDYEEKLSSSNAQRTANALAWLKTVKDAGYEPMFYSYYNLMNTSFDMPLIDSLYRVWIAHYNSSCSYLGTYDTWQYGSAYLTGYSGGLDGNYWYYNNNAEVTKPGTLSIKNADVSLSNTSYVYTKYAKKPTVTVRYGGKTLTKGTDYKVYYVKNVLAGTGYAWIKGINGYSNVKLVPFTITKADFSEAVVSNISDRTYTGSPIKPSVTVKYRNTTLKTCDYTVSYSNNTDAGTATVTVKGRRNYTGSVKKTFKISKAKPTFSGDSSYTKTTLYNWFKLNTKTNSGGRLTYSSSDPSILTVDSNGKVSTKHKAGTATITVNCASTSDYSEGTKKITVTIRKVDQKLTGTTEYNKTPVSVPFELDASSNINADLSFTSSDKDVVSVSSSGKITFNGTGKATVTVKAASTDIYNSATLKVSFSVRPVQQVIKVTSPSKGTLKVYLKTDAENASGYQIVYSRNKDFSGTVYTRTSYVPEAKSRAYAVTSGKTYYVKARSFYTNEDGTRIYGLYNYKVQTIKVL